MADGDKRVTRSQATNNQPNNNLLGFSDYLWGARARTARSPTPSPNPSPIPSTETNEQVFFPSPETNSLPPITHRVEMAESDPLNTLTTALSGLQVSSRKPELPPFDKNSIQKWIRRVESAYIRSGITSPVEKFAFIESKFPVDEDPAVDEFLFGEPTEENWNNFCKYLTQRYGKTKRQKVASILEPISMDGRTPSQFFAKLKQNYGDITLDDIVKELCIRQLPTDLQQTIYKDTEDLPAKETMSFADKYYNPDGSRVHKKQPTVNVVKANASQNATPFSQPFQDDRDDDNNCEINAIGNRGNPQRGRQNGNNSARFDRSKSRGRFYNNNNGSNSNNNNNGGGFFSGRNGNGNNGGFQNRNNNNNRQQDPSLCFYHNMYGEKAKKCDIGCAKSKPGNGLSPRQ